MTKLFCTDTLKRVFLLFGLLLWLAPLYAVAGTDHAARVSLLRGDVSLVENQALQPRPLHRGDYVSPGDTIITGAKGVVQLVFADRSMLYIKSDSRVKLEAFLFEEGGVPTDNEAVMELLEGGIRSITGMIGRTSPESIRYKANDTTVGIRGTALEIAASADGATAVAFDFGQGYVDTEQRGVCIRTEVGRNEQWVLDGGVARRGQIERTPEDPSRIASELVNAPRDKARAIAAERGHNMQLEEVLLVLGMMQELPFFEDKTLFDAVAGFSGAVDRKEQRPMLTATTMVYPEMAPTILEAALAARVPRVEAVSGTLCGLGGQSPDARDSLVRKATALGVSPAEAREVLDFVTAGRCYSG